MKKIVAWAAIAVAVALQPRVAHGDVTDATPTGPTGIGSTEFTGRMSADPFDLAKVDPSTGQLGTRVTFHSPPPRGRVQSTLSLVYSSAAGDGFAGHGWTLDLPAIERRTPSGRIGNGSGSGPPPSESAPRHPSPPPVRVSCDGITGACAHEQETSSLAWGYSFLLWGQPGTSVPGVVEGFNEGTKGQAGYLALAEIQTGVGLAILAAPEIAGGGVGVGLGTAGRVGGAWREVGIQAYGAAPTAVRVGVPILLGVAQGVNGDTGPLTAEGVVASDAINGPRLAKQLVQQEAESAFTASGTLAQGAIQGAKQIIPPGQLGNPAIPQGFGKFSTQTFRSPSGPFQVHFYMNPSTGEVFYGVDFKAIFNGERGPTYFQPFGGSAP
jgi:Salmonella virulence plasmid 65kDa B protein